MDKWPTAAEVEDEAATRRISGEITAAEQLDFLASILGSMEQVGTPMTDAWLDRYNDAHRRIVSGRYYMRNSPAEDSDIKAMEEVAEQFRNLERLLGAVREQKELEAVRFRNQLENLRHKASKPRRDTGHHCEYRVQLEAVKQSVDAAMKEKKA